MTTADTLSLIFGITGALLGLASLIVSFNSKRLADRQTALEEGNSEWELFKAITESRLNFESNSVKAVELNCSFALNPNLDKSKLPQLERICTSLVKSSLESYFNAYEEACSKYLDNKIDKARFEISYKKDIENLIKDHTAYFGADTRYHAIVRVHQKWTNPEKP
jgi:hypothetical protein